MIIILTDMYINIELYPRKYFPISGIGRGVEGWLRDILSGGNTELEKLELELSDVCNDREGRRNIREKIFGFPVWPELSGGVVTDRADGLVYGLSLSKLQHNIE